MTVQKTRASTPAAKAQTAEIPGLPIAAQVLLEHIQKAKTQGERSEIHGRLSNYVEGFSQKDIPQSAGEALNKALAKYDLPAVRIPVSGNQAAFENLAQRYMSQTTSRSSHTGRDHDIPAEHLAARREAVGRIFSTVRKLGSSLTNAELNDAAAILEMSVRNARA